MIEGQSVLRGDNAHSSSAGQSANGLLGQKGSDCDLAIGAKLSGGMILQFSGGRESDSFWGCCRPGILMVCRTPS